eukprot:s3009_g11.t1
MNWAEACKTESESESGQCDSPSPREDPRPRCYKRFSCHKLAHGVRRRWETSNCPRRLPWRCNVVPLDDSSSGECSPEPGVRLPHFARHRPLPPPPPPPTTVTTPPRNRTRPVVGGGASEDQRSMSPFGKDKAPPRRAGADSGVPSFKSWGAFGMGKTPEDAHGSMSGDMVEHSNPISWPGVSLGIYD